MKARSVRTWLDRKLEVDARLCLLAAVLLVPLGLLVCFIEFWALYGFLWLFLRGLFGQIELMIAAGLALAALFFWQTTIPPEPDQEFRFEARSGRRSRVSIPARTGIGIDLVFTGPEADRLSAGYFRNLLLSGPRLLMGTMHLWNAAAKLRAFDREQIGQVLSLLIRCEGKLPFSLLQEELPDVDLDVLSSQLRMIDGIIFLKNPPPGISVARYLLDEMDDWKQAASGA